MEGILNKKMEGVSASKGITLIELLVALALVALLSNMAMAGYRSIVQLSSQMSAKSYLLKLQSIQSRQWLRKGSYLSLIDMPALELDETEVKQDYLTSENYRFTINLMFMKEGSKCRTLSISEGKRWPEQCW